MKTSIWYHTADRQPDKTGYYMGFRTITLADDTCGVDYFWWNKEEGEWRTDQTCHSRWVNVYYWTPEDPEKWVDEDGPVRNRKPRKSNVALDAAFANVQKSVEQYEILKALVRTEER